MSFFYNGNISSPSPYLEKQLLKYIGMYLDHSYPVELAFIPWHLILGAISRNGTGGQNLGQPYNMIDS